DYDRVVAFISSGGRRFHTIIQPYTGPLPTEWLDAPVILRGVSWTETDDENKPRGFVLHVFGTNQVTFLKPGRSNILDQATIPLVNHQHLHKQSDTRIKVSGTVTYHSPSGTVFLQDTEGAAQARLFVPLPRGNADGFYVDRPPMPKLHPGQRI